MRKHAHRRAALLSGRSFWSSSIDDTSLQRGIALNFGSIRCRTMAGTGRCLRQERSLVLPARKQLVEEALGGDTIASIAQNPVPIHLCVEDPDARQLQREATSSRFKLRLANTEDRRNSANCLVQRRYAWRNYKIGETRSNDPARIALAAHGNNGIVGTVSVGLDTDGGMFVDDLYPDEANALRRDG